MLVYPYLFLFFSKIILCHLNIFPSAIRLTGPFVTMIYSMITGDMFTFGIIYCIVLCGFSQAFYFLYKGHPQIQSTMFNTFPSTWMALFQTTLGDYNVSFLELMKIFLKEKKKERKIHILKPKTERHSKEVFLLLKRLKLKTIYFPKTQ